MVYIFGHKNPDTDSIVSAIALSYLLKKQRKQAMAVSPGELNSETKFVLQKFNVQEPPLLNKEICKKAILVDHNESEHRPEGNFKILEIWDHHRFKFSYGEPIFILCQPVGSTASILAKEFFQKEIEIPKELAGLMISAILSDTLIFKSSTTTEFDREMAQKLNRDLNLDLETLGIEIKKAGMNFGEPIKNLILRDFKEYLFADKKTGISQLELFDIESFLQGRREEILERMKEIKKDKNYDCLIFAITDIFKQGSELFCLGEEKKIEKIFNKKLQKNSFWVKDLMSRKKEIVPLLGTVFAANH